MVENKGGRAKLPIPAAKCTDCADCKKMQNITRFMKSIHFNGIMATSGFTVTD